MIAHTRSYKTVWPPLLYNERGVLHLAAHPQIIFHVKFSPITGFTPTKSGFRNR